MRDKEALDILLNQIIQYRQKTLFLKLVQAGLDVHYHIIQTNILDQRRWKPMLPSGRAIMHQAILWDVRWLVDYLLKEGYDINLQSPIGCSPLLWAIRNCQVGDEAAKRNLIHSLIDQPDCRLDLPALHHPGSTPITKLVGWDGQEEVLRHLIRTHSETRKGGA